jgi:hypothetical protein
MDYDAILRKMNLYYFEGKLHQEDRLQPQPQIRQPQPQQPQYQQPQNQQYQPQPRMTKEQFFQLKKKQLEAKKQIQINQQEKRKLLLPNTITAKTQLKQMNIKN